MACSVFLALAEGRSGKPQMYALIVLCEGVQLEQTIQVAGPLLFLLLDSLTVV